MSETRARQLISEKIKWRLNPEQEAWVREQRWQISLTALDEVEQPPPPRVPRSQTPSIIKTTPAPGTPTPSNIGAAGAQGVHKTEKQLAPSILGSGPQETTSSVKEPTKEEHISQTQSKEDSPVELHDANITTADFVEVRAHIRSYPQRSRSQQIQTQEERSEAVSGLNKTSANDKSALEQCGREFATRKLENLGYKVTPMSQRNPGFDLRAEKPGEKLKVEVKAHAGEASSVFVTQSEWEEYKKTQYSSNEAWELWNVENLAKASGRMPTIQRIRIIPKSALKERGYWVDLMQCS